MTNDLAGPRRGAAPIVGAADLRPRWSTEPAHHADSLLRAADRAL
jgi:hypothetical protein